MRSHSRLLALITFTVVAAGQSVDPPGLQFTLRGSGLATLTLSGTGILLRDAGQPKFASVTLIDNQNRQISGSIVPISASADQSTNSVTAIYRWGAVNIRYAVPSSNKLTLTITVRNTTPDLTLRDLWLFPLGLELPGRVRNRIPTSLNNIDSPTSIWADYGAGSVDLVNDDISHPLGLTLWPAENPFLSKCVVSVRVGPLEKGNSNTPPLRPIAPGASDTYHLSLRFGQPGDTEADLARDLFERYRQAYPPVVRPMPRQPLAGLFPNSSFRNKPAFARNPRGWLNDPSIDVTTAAGIASFQQRLLTWADNAVAEMKRVGAQGGIIWCIEGQQLPTSYIGDPSQAEKLAPELVGVIDPFVKKFTNAGFKIGFTLRTQLHRVYRGTVNVSGNEVSLVRGDRFDAAWVSDPEPQLGINIGQQVYTIKSVTSTTSLTLAASAGTQANIPYSLGQQHNPADPEAVLRNKVSYAQKRWGSTLFYVDSDANWAGNVNPASMYQHVAAEFPGVVFFPEERSTLDWAYTHPYIDSRNNGPEPEYSAKKVYPEGTALVAVPGDDAIDTQYSRLLQAARDGNVLLFGGWYRHHANDVVRQIYQTLSKDQAASAPHDPVEKHSQILP